MDWVTVVIGVAAIGWIVWMLARRPDSSAGHAPSAPDADYSEYLTPRPLGPPFEEDGWDGFTGLQMALGVELSEGLCHPLITAGTIPPVSATRTVSTSKADQERLTIALYAGLSSDIEKCELVQRVTITGIPVTGEEIRSIDVTCTVDENGVVEVAARGASDGLSLACLIGERGVQAIPIGCR